MWTIETPSRPVLLVCVADEVGSKPLSHMGSARACRALHDVPPHFLTEVLDADEARRAELCQKIVERVARDVAATAEGWEVPPRDLSTTLVAAVVEQARPARAVVFAVGDSPAFLLREGAFYPLTGGDDGDDVIATSATHALPANFGGVRVTACAVGEDDVLLLCTDGLGNPMRDANVRSWLARWRPDGGGPIPGVLEFGWQLSFRAQTYGDDRTAICVWGR